ncbi:MAG: ABC transporter substrate-binding protein [Deltaproteobacteria bacterium]|nr:ABC transporter substrate-binding protein [Deltaproteobacteria bacterium]
MGKKIATGLVVILAAAAVVVGVIIYQGDGGEAKPKVVIYNLLSHPILDASVKGIKDSLAEEGFGPDKLEIIEVNANGEMDKLNAFAKEVLAVNPKVVIPVSTPVTQAVFKEAPPTQLIVFSTVTNPSDVGMDGNPINMTGVCDAVNYEANFNLIFELFPQTKRIGVIYNAGERNSQYGVDQIKKLAEQKGIKLELVTVSKSQEVVDAAHSLIGNVDVFYVGSDNTVVSAIGGLTKVAYEARIPVIASDSGSVSEGALAAVSVDYEELGRRTGTIVAEVLRTGALPADRKPIMFLGNTLILNQKAANRIGYEFPDAVEQRAAQVVQ